MLLTIITIVTGLLALGLGALNLLALGNLMLRLNGIAAQAEANADENILQHRITRSYLVEILERRLLPHIGWREPEKTPIERWMRERWDAETTENV